MVKCRECGHFYSLGGNHLCQPEPSPKTVKLDVRPLPERYADDGVSYTPGAVSNGEFTVTDTGHRKVFETGAQRDAAPGKGWFHALPFIAIERWAKWLELGGRKYNKHNWRKGIPLSAYLNSAGNHLGKLCESLVSGEPEAEDHAAAVLWNIGGFIWTQDQIKRGKLPATLDDVQGEDYAEHLREKTVMPDNR